VTSHQTPGWGILLGGEPFDLEDWQEALQQPFDPWVIKTDDGLILRSRDLDYATTSSEANALGMALLAQANGAFGASQIRTGPARGRCSILAGQQATAARDCLVSNKRREGSDEGNRCRYRP
jgi:hypothetical protein